MTSERVNDLLDEAVGAAIAEVAETARLHQVSAVLFDGTLAGFLVKTGVAIMRTALDEATIRQMLERVIVDSRSPLTPEVIQ